MSWAHYLLQVNIYLVTFYCFFKLLLDKETYFHLNRIYLIASGILSLTIPFMRFEWLSRQPVSKQVYIGVDQFSSFMANAQVISVKAETFTWGNFMVTLYVCGLLFCLSRFIYRLILLQSTFRQAKKGMAFSFFHKKVISADVPEPATIHVHEEIHIRQNHSLDILFFECLAIFTWFNPVIYAYKHAVKNIHEFLADEAAANFQGDKEAYSLLLLSRAFGASPSDLTNGFFTRSLIKKRIFMLHKKRSKKTAILKYGLFVPLFALTLILSSATVRKNDRLMEVAAQLPLDNVGEAVGRTLKTPLQLVEVVIADKPVSAEKTTTVPTLKFDAKALNRMATVSDTTPSETPKGYDDLPKVTVSNMMISPVAEEKEIESPVYNFTNIGQTASYPGGIQKFYDFLGQSIKYPADAVANNKQGIVYTSFVVEKDGTLSDIKTEGRKIGYGLEEEAIRILRQSKRWNPGLADGKPVRMKYNIPIRFALPTVTLKNAALKNNLSGTELAIRELVSESHAKSIKEIMLVVDGKVESWDNFNQQKPEHIESITVLKSGDSMALYGPAAENGVILVTTKKIPVNK